MYFPLRGGVKAAWRPLKPYDAGSSPALAAYAELVEPADTLASKPSAFERTGSTPVLGIHAETSLGRLRRFIPFSIVCSIRTSAIRPSSPIGRGIRLKSGPVRVRISRGACSTHALVAQWQEPYPFGLRALVFHTSGREFDPRQAHCSTQHGGCSIMAECSWL